MEAPGPGGQSRVVHHDGAVLRGNAGDPGAGRRAGRPGSRTSHPPVPRRCEPGRFGPRGACPGVGRRLCHRTRPAARDADPRPRWSFRDAGLPGGGRAPRAPGRDRRTVPRRPEHSGVCDRPGHPAPQRGRHAPGRPARAAAPGVRRWPATGPAHGVGRRTRHGGSPGRGRPGRLPADPRRRGPGAAHRLPLRRASGPDAHAAGPAQPRAGHRGRRHARPPARSVHGDRPAQERGAPRCPPGRAGGGVRGPLRGPGSAGSRPVDPRADPLVPRGRLPAATGPHRAHGRGIS
ncbi:hypothetical protein GALL_467640 [mine drainage metagenome]|uniref:Uncharacterized protein n=1 Tax=mine drainage metagenome TaxID=410659 RepID=A0A1J5PJ52_9ZZZZ